MLSDAVTVPTFHVGGACCNSKFRDVQGLLGLPCLQWVQEYCGEMKALQLQDACYKASSLKEQRKTRHDNDENKKTQKRSVGPEASGLPEVPRKPQSKKKTELQQHATMETSPISKEGLQRRTTSWHQPSPTSCSLNILDRPTGMESQQSAVANLSCAGALPHTLRLCAFAPSGRCQITVKLLGRVEKQRQANDL